MIAEDSGMRERLLTFMNVATGSVCASYSGMIAKCKMCSKSLAGAKERLAAHFAKGSGVGIKNMIFYFVAAWLRGCF